MSAFAWSSISRLCNQSPLNYYEAASIDGATRLQQFRYVTWPLLRPTTFLLLILNVIHSFQVFDLIFVMTGGGPGFSTTMIVQYIYQSAFASSEMGYASAMGIVLFVLILLLHTFAMACEPADRELRFEERL